MQKTNNRYLTWATAALATLSSAYSTAQQAQRSGLDVTAQASVNLVDQNVSSEIAFPGQTTLTIRPQLNASYQSRYFFGLFTGSVTRLERDVDEFDQEDTYTEYSYNLSWQPVDNYVTVQASGALNYQNAFANNFLINDFVNDLGELLKTRSNQLTAIANLPNGNYIQGNGSISYSQVRAESNPQFNNNIGLDNDVYSLQATLQDGDRIRNLNWRVQGSFVNSDQPAGVGGQNLAGGQGEFTNRRILADSDIGLWRRLALRLSAQHEGNQLANETRAFTNVQEFNTYGAGLSYRVSDNRYIAVTYNTIDSDSQRDDGNTFVGLDMRWALTPRTGLNASYTQRFFGESGNVDFSYNTKRFRSSITYTEDITNFSLLIANPQNLGVFVCPAGESSIGQCFQPNSLNYQPQAGEQLVQFNTQNLEVNDNVILRKSTNSQLGYSFSRVTLGMFALYAEETFLDSDAIRRTLSAGFDLNYTIGSRTNLVSRVAYADILGIGEIGEGQNGRFIPGESQNLNARIGINNRIGQSLTINTSVNFLRQSGDMPFGLFGANFKDRRISVGITYRYE